MLAFPDLSDLSLSKRSFAGPASPQQATKHGDALRHDVTADEHFVVAALIASLSLRSRLPVDPPRRQPPRRRKRVGNYGEDAELWRRAGISHGP